MNLEKENIYNNIQWTKAINIEGISDYIIKNDELFNDINKWIEIVDLGLYTDNQINIEVRNIIHEHFKNRYSKDYKNDWFIDWIISDWIEHLLDVPYVIKELKKHKLINE